MNKDLSFETTEGSSEFNLKWTFRLGIFAFLWIAIILGLVFYYGFPHKMFGVESLLIPASIVVFVMLLIPSFSMILFSRQKRTTRIAWRCLYIFFMSIGVICSIVVPIVFAF